MLFHGDEDRQVNDLDIWIDNKTQNAQKCFEALQAVMPGSLPFAPGSLSIRGRIIDLRGARYDVEIFTSMDEIEFEDAFSRRGKQTQDGDGESLYFIGVQDLLRIKKNAYNSCRERMEKEAKDIVFLESMVWRGGTLIRTNEIVRR